MCEENGVERGFCFRTDGQMNEKKKKILRKQV